MALAAASCGVMRAVLCRGSPVGDLSSRQPSSRVDSHRHALCSGTPFFQAGSTRPLRHLSPLAPASPSLSADPLIGSRQSTGALASVSSRSSVPLLQPDTPSSTAADAEHPFDSLSQEHVKRVRSPEEFDAVLQEAQHSLVVVKFATMKNAQSQLVYPTMVSLAATCTDVVFLLVVADESDSTRALAAREGVTRIPHFVFYQDGRKVHEESGLAADAEALKGNLLYYGSQETGVLELSSGAELTALVEGSVDHDQLVVVDVSLTHCGPCVRVYPTFVNLSQRMVGKAVFARLLGDTNDDTEAVLTELGVKEVPTFFFIRNGKYLGQYVGSGKGDLIGEILRHEGVKVT